MSAPRRPRATRRYCLLILAGFAALTLPLAILNYRQDPYGYFARLDGRPQRIGQDQCKTRIAKAEILLAGNWKTALLGSSRVETGFDPQRFDSDERACNLGLSATCIQETRYVSQLVAKQPEVKHVVVCVDFGSFADGAEPARDFAHSLFNPDRGTAEHCIANFLGLRSTTISVARWVAGGDDPPVLQPTGFREGREQSAAVQRQRIEDQLIRFVTAGRTQGFRYSGIKMREFQLLLESCQAGGKAVDVVILPTHALYLEIIQRQGNWSAFEDWKRDLVDVVGSVYAPGKRPKIYDFTDYLGVNSEAIPDRGPKAVPMTWYWEVAHFRSVLGTRIVDVIGRDEEASDECERLVVRVLDPQNLDAALESIRRGREVYLQRRPQDVALLQSLFPAASGPVVSTN